MVFENAPCYRLGPLGLVVTPWCPESLRSARDGEHTWTLDSFEIVKEYASASGISSVYKANCKRGGGSLAIKSYHKAKLSPSMRGRVLREVDIHRQINHPYIIKLFAAWEDATAYHIAMVGPGACMASSGPFPPDPFQPLTGVCGERRRVRLSVRAGGVPGRDRVRAKGHLPAAHCPPVPAPPGEHALFTHECKFGAGGEMGCVPAYV